MNADLRLVAIDPGGVVREGGSDPGVPVDMLRQTAALYERAGFVEPWICYLAMREGSAVGTCGFTAPPSEGRVEIAYFTFPEHEGRGHATTMAFALVAMARDRDPLVTVVARTLPVRNASHRVLEKLGFSPAETRQDPEDGTVWEWRLATDDARLLDSTSVGDPARFRSQEELTRALASLPTIPSSAGRLALIVRRGAGGRRETPERIVAEPATGIPGDAWGRAPSPHPDAQISVMQRDVATLIANGQPLALFGDNLFVDLDLSARNLPPGTRLRAGGAVLLVTPKPHNGCRKFKARFGDGALRFVSDPALRLRNLRGVYVRVVTAGAIRVGDRFEVLDRSDP